jgi:flavodoxin I
MTSIGLFYGSKRGDTENVAYGIKEAFDAIQPDLLTVFNVKKVELSKMMEFEKLILGSSTWEGGNVQMNWLRKLPQMESVDLSGKQVAVFGLGDQMEFADTFQSAIGVLARKARDQGAELVGRWPTEGYTFTASEGVEDGHFFGLSIDTMNQHHLTDKRIKMWVEQLAKEFGVQ